jgi:hypothetical protein
VGILGEREQKMLEGRIFVPAAAGFSQGGVQRLLEFAGEGRQFDYSSKPACDHGLFTLNVGLRTAGIKRTFEKAGEKAEGSPASSFLE